MTDEGLVYFLSPFGLTLLLSAAFFALLPFVAWYRRKGLDDEDGTTKLHVAVLGGLAFVILILGLLVSRATTPQWQLVIHRDYFSCRSWGERVPWRHFSSVRLEWSGLNDANLRFDLLPAYLDRSRWNDQVKSQGWVWCSISDVTDNPRRFAWPTDTNKIYNHALEAWQAGKWCPRLSC